MANAQLSQKLGQALAQQFEKFANVVVVSRVHGKDRVRAYCDSERVVHTHPWLAHPPQETGHVHNDDQLQRILAGLKVVSAQKIQGRGSIGDVLSPAEGCSSCSRGAGVCPPRFDRSRSLSNL